MLTSDRDLLECRSEVANITILNLLRLGILLAVQTFVSSAPIRTVHIDGAHEISQIIASGSLGWATACIGHADICASFIQMLGQMLWVSLKGRENRSRSEIAPSMSITWPMTWPLTLPVTWRFWRLGAGPNADMKCPNTPMQYVIMCCGSKAIGSHVRCPRRKRTLTLTTIAFQTKALDLEYLR